MGKGKRNRQNRAMESDYEKTLEDGAVIKHQRCSCCGEWFSVLYIGGYEMYSVPIEQEEQMIKEYQDGTLNGGKLTSRWIYEE